MVLLKEYRICMPLTVEEYRVGQLYMIARHSLEQSESGEGVEVIVNVPCEHPEHGKGQYTEKRIHLSSRLPFWIQSFLPRVFYVTEKAWNYYPYTITEYTCSFIPKFSIHIQTKFENNNGSSENCLNLTPEQLEQRTVDFVDICYDEISPRHYKEEEDLRFYQSSVTKRGPLAEGWTSTTQPIMCSYKVVQANFDVWGLQTKAEELIQRSIREILLLGHRQAFAWVDEWYNMTLADVRVFESEMHRQTNTKVTEDLPSVPTTPLTPPAPTTPTVANRSSWFPWQ
ncbi:cytoplasmic phosphatidylinositol transfer protein 1 [Homalodisca vitripennis]|uniref:cytoplasmic phosphatidylinositol transfer protein 1 n=1 Tax=Homalodisca vitripennis TaxID=197043 RepID=UPI001EEC6671|nr:cytoplasmic phosphatidylinositol transfer protein 1 [Homalodisca vitripennis]